MLSSGIQDTMVEKVTKSLSKSKDDDIEVMQIWGLTIISFSAQKFWVNFDFCPSPLKILASITVCPFLTISPQAMTQKKVHLTIWIHVQREHWWEWRKYQPWDIAWFKSTFGGLKDRANDRYLIVGSQKVKYNSYSVTIQKELQYVYPSSSS